MRNHYRARFFSPDRRQPPPSNEGGAGRRRLAGLHGLMCEKKTHQKFYRSRRKSRHPARSVGGFIPAEPRRSYQAFLLGEALLSAAGEPLTGRSVFGIREHQTRRLCAPRSARRTQQASAAARRANAPRPPLPTRTFQVRIRNGPSWAGTGKNIVLLLRMSALPGPSHRKHSLHIEAQVPFEKSGNDSASFKFNPRSTLGGKLG